MKTAEHPSGEIISFTEADHSYKDTQGKSYHSVTTFIHTFFPEFDTEAVSARYAERHNLSQDEVKKAWKENGDQAADFGSRVHAFAEAKLKGIDLPMPTNGKDEMYFKAVDTFINTELSGYKLIESEKIIFSPKYLLAGTVDLLMKNRKGQLCIMDWKTNKAIKFDNVYQHGLDFFSHLDDCNYNHYSLQLNLYRRLLAEEGYFRNAVEAPMQLLFVKRDKVQVIPVAVMDDEINNLLGTRQ
jgi:ATP-dependent exoDNAse (exonuclease V) beta subunit